MWPDQGRTLSPMHDTNRAIEDFDSAQGHPVTRPSALASEPRLAPVQASGLVAGPQGEQAVVQARRFRSLELGREVGAH